MAGGFINGRMADHIMASIKMIRSMDLEFILGKILKICKKFKIGQMVEDTKEVGRMGNSMEKQNIFRVKLKCELDSGIMEKGLSGLKKRNLDRLSTLL